MVSFWFFSKAENMELNERLLTSKILCLLGLFVCAFLKLCSSKKEGLQAKSHQLATKLGFLM